MRSMTGCGRAQETDGQWSVTAEVRTVNHRFLDIACRLPRNLGFLESVVRGRLNAALRRGHAEVYLQVQPEGSAAGRVSLDEALALDYIRAAKELGKLSGRADRLRNAELLTLPGVASLSEPEMDEEAVSALAGKALDGALRELVAMREKEGAALRRDLALHLDAAAALRERIAERAPRVVTDYRQRLLERLAEMNAPEVDPVRLAQEVALMADRCAIDEELARLDSHIAQMRAYLDAEGETGKKMDFLIQEMNREANTIGSKANDAEIAHWVVDLKSEIEKLREQVQNAE